MMSPAVRCGRRSGRALMAKEAVKREAAHGRFAYALEKIGDP
jgi:hypothetical protein